jgi:tetratricopeptide (TPR) repeat protein
VNLPHWRNSETIFRHTIAVTENNFLAETNLGVYLERAGRIAEAYQLYEIAYRHNPAYPEAINHLGLVRAEQNRMQEAFELFTESVRRRPGFTVARYNRGLALVRLGREVEAGAEWLEVLRSAPTYKDVEPSLEWLARVAFSRPCNALRGVDTDAASRFSEIVTVTEAQLRQRGFLEQFRYAEQCARAGVVR